ncbi:anthranilate synthase component I family protein [Persephonella sp.]|uniref:anthranilate synthase component I family protein n=1 Tax=Persephonella sp. TaxID=2060922 RepID=UPI002626C8C2|nr:anthranilate synthase component I family protein [Persephonella sp.]
MKIEFFSDKEKWLSGYKYITINKPVYRAIYKSNILIINNKIIKTTNPLPILEKLILKNKLFAAGFISYDYKKHLFPEKSHKKDDIGLPEIYMIFFKNFEPQLKKEKKHSSLIKKIKFPDKNRFIKMVQKAKKYISEGDIYQVNLSHRIEIDGFFNIDKIFRNLIKYQPAPYLMHIQEKNFSLISGSMELFLEKTGKKIYTKPIKGTRPVGKNYYNELLNSEKERAENLMITDLMRNDLGRIAVAGSVHVEKLFDIEEYNSLLQMVSTISAEINENTLFSHIIKNTFPPGSVTGAPKKRAIEIIDELEEHRRGVYCGITFLIKPNLDFVSSVAIRQSIFKKNKTYVYIGSGIVADSDPESEYQETILKAKANLHAMGLKLDIL